MFEVPGAVAGTLRLAALGNMGWQETAAIDQTATDDCRMLGGAAVEDRADRAVG
jgi:hypothetical protein